MAASGDSLQRVPAIVLGAGSWGTALAVLLARNGQPTSLWGRNAAQMAQMAASGCNQQYLPGIQLPQALHISHELPAAAAKARDFLLAVPSHAFRSTLEQIAPFLKPDSRLVWATKGFEPDSGKLLHQIVADVFGESYPVAVISGPTFAAEVAKGLPTAVTIASPSTEFAAELALRLRSDSFRAYTSQDMAGVEVGGAVKNVLAIAAGISDGLGFGANARAALITRGLSEVMRLGVALGGQRETLMGLAGLGDLVLTCTDDQSRNRRFGLALGRGEDLAAARRSIAQVIEGASAAQEARRLAQSQGIEMPITEQVYQVLYHGRAPREAVGLLLQRELKSE